jgi:hypothetical protein
VILFLKRNEFCAEEKIPDKLERIWGKRIIYAGSPRSNDDGIPFIDSWFQDGVKLARTKYVSMINADIVLSAQWYPYIINLLESLAPPYRPFVFSPRLNVNFTDEAFAWVRLNNENVLKDVDKAVMQLRWERNDGGGVDIFTFARSKPPVDLDAIPPFLIGRPVWDFWVIGWSNEIADTISTDFTPPIYHLDHKSRNRNRADPTVRYNTKLGKRRGRFFAGVGSTKWLAVDGVLQANPDWRKATRRIRRRASHLGTPVVPSGVIPERGHQPSTPSPLPTSERSPSPTPPAPRHPRGGPLRHRGRRIGS